MKKRWNRPGVGIDLVPDFCGTAKGLLKQETLLGGAQQNTLFTVAHLDRERYEPVLITGANGLLVEEARQMNGVRLAMRERGRVRFHAADFAVHVVAQAEDHVG